METKNNVVSLEDVRKKKELPKPHQTHIDFWIGGEGRRIDFYDPCPCGCDTRDDPDLLGYLSGSNDESEGFTISVYDPDTYEHMRKIFSEHINGKEQNGKDKIIN